MHVRALQSDLMVAALSCQARDRYNTVVTRLRAPLTQHGAALRQYFQRLHGSAHHPKLNTFVTALANDASTRSLQERDTFCQRAHALMDKLMTVDLNAVHRVAVLYGAAESRAPVGCTQKLVELGIPSLSTP